MDRRVMDSRIARLAVLAVLTTLLAACGGPKVGAATGTAAPPLDFADVDSRVQEYLTCAIPAGRAKHLNEDAYVAAAIRDAGLAALRRNAVEVAGSLVRRYEASDAASGDETSRGQDYLEAIVAAAGMSSVPEPLRAKARAYEAYYQSLAVGDACKLDPEVLKLINKS